MEIWKVKNGEDPVDALIKGLEKSVGSEIYTFKILEENRNGLKSIIVFEDKRVLYGYIKPDLSTMPEYLGMRLQAEFI